MKTTSNFIQYFLRDVRTNIQLDENSKNSILGFYFPYECTFYYDSHLPIIFYLSKRKLYILYNILIILMYTK